MRTRTSPNCRVRQIALPVVPACSVGSMLDQSVTPKGIPESFMAAVLPMGLARFLHAALAPRRFEDLVALRLAPALRVVVELLFGACR